MAEHNQTPERPMSAFARLEEVLRDEQSLVLHIGKSGDGQVDCYSWDSSGKNGGYGPMVKKNITAFIDGFEIKKTPEGSRLSDSTATMLTAYDYFELYLTTANMYASYARPKKEVPSTELK